MARAWVLMVAVAVPLAACADGVGPPAADEIPEQALQSMRWSPILGTPTFAARSTGSNPDVHRSGAGESALASLETKQTSFWAHKSRATSVEIHYRAADGSWKPFAELTVPAGALYRRPNGQLFKAGDSTLITVTMDLQTVEVSFEPSGLVFNPTVPARFDLWYTGADPDLDQNGRLDAADEQIRRTLLGVWVQQDSADPWTTVSASHALDSKLFEAGLQHFSKYRSAFKRGGVAVSF